MYFEAPAAVYKRPLNEAQVQKEKDGPDWLNDSPAQAQSAEDEQKDHNQNLAKLRESPDEGYREAIAGALNAPPPTVRADERVYSRTPRGWPPSA